MTNKPSLNTGVPAVTAAMASGFLESFPDGIIFIDNDGAISFFNQEAGRIFGYARDEIIGKPVELLILPEMHERHVDGIKQLRQCDDVSVSGKKTEIKGLRKDGGSVPIEWSYHMFKDDSATLFFCCVTDISERTELQNKLYRQTITDPLTGLFNRRYFDERLKQEFSRASRYRRNFSLVIIDIDGFKQANDLHGHAFGDEMLVKASKLFLEVLRDEDTIYRYGGDEFAMILPETPKEGAIELAERLRRKFAKRCCVEDKRLKFTLSIGIASHPDDGEEEDELVGTADRRMYHSKGNGGNLITAHQMREELESDEDAVLRSLNTLVYAIEKKLGGKSAAGLSHSQEIRSLALAIGRRLGMSVERLYLLEQAAVLHDFGILYVQSSIMGKPGELTREEMDEIQRHAIVGEQILGLLAAETSDLADLPKVVGQHHEWMDGGGYPRGLKGEEIFMEARILGLCDAYSAMRTHRAHRSALTEEEAISELKRLSGSQFDPKVVDALLDVLKAT
jgi:diguanylate cyclase (GGDEF)-like protein/PAS domain S-box-containing protein